MDVQITAEQVEALVNTFLSRLKPEDYPHVAINWGDLSASEVLQFKDEIWHVVIEEAAPSAWELQRDVYLYLKDLGIKAQVRTEW